VPAGQSPWLFEGSPAEALAIDLSQRARTLLRPEERISWTSAERVAALQSVAHASVMPSALDAGAQNYVAIYPSLYYQLTGLILRVFHVRNVLSAVYVARFINALWLGITGLVLDQILSLVILSRRLRWGALLTFSLFVPTLGVLGGAVNNDIVADMVSLVIFWASLWSVRIGSKLVKLRYAVGLGFLAGIAVWTKEEVYLALLVSVPFVLRAVWRNAESARARWFWLSTAVGIAGVVAWPWLGLTLHRYQSIIPPMTYQSSGSNPRTLAFILMHELLSLRFESDLMVTQLLFGIDCPWWQPWMSYPWIHWVLGMMGVSSVMGGLWIAWHKPGRGLALAWILGGTTMLWVLQWPFTNS